MKKRLIFKLSIIFFSLFSSFVSLAQEKDTLISTVLQLSLEKMDKEAKEKDLLIQTSSTASKMEEKTSDAAAIMQVVSKQEIDAFGGNYLPDILNRLTGMLVVGSYIFPNNIPTIRGDLGLHTTSHVLILINGRPCREILFGGIDMAVLSNIPLASVEKIEIIRGPGSVLYGTNAFSGVINIITVASLDTSTIFKATLGHFGTVGMEARQTYQKEKFKVEVSGRFFGQKGWGATIKDDRDSVRTMPTENQNASFLANIKYGKLSLLAFYGYSEYNIFGDGTTWNATAPADLYWDRLRTRRMTADLGYEIKPMQKWRITINNTFNLFWLNYPRTGAFADVTSRENLLEINNFIKPRKNLSIIFGGLLNLTWLEDNSIDENFKPVKIYQNAILNDIEQRFAGYGQVEYSPFKFLKLIAGGQINKNPSIDANISPRVGLIAYLKPNIGAKILYGQAFRSATLSDRYFNTATLIGNTQIRPEEMKTAEMQVFLYQPKYELAATYFYSSLSGAIQRSFVPNSTTVRTFTNQESIDFQGFEAEGKYKSSHWLLTGSYAYQYNVNNEKESNVTTIPNHMLKIGLSYKTKNNAFKMGFFNSYFSQPADVINSQSTDATKRKIKNPVPQAFNLLSLNLDINLGKLLKIKDIDVISLNIYAENLLDEQIYYPEFSRKTLNSIPYQTVGGRAFYVKAGISF
jgi:outer membrane receptor for ferrienterochelin and colicin